MNSVSCCIYLHCLRSWAGDGQGLQTDNASVYRRIGLSGLTDTGGLMGGGGGAVKIKYY